MCGRLVCYVVPCVLDCCCAQVDGFGMRTGTREAMIQALEEIWTALNPRDVAAAGVAPQGSAKADADGVGATSAKRRASSFVHVADR